MAAGGSSGNLQKHTVPAGSRVSCATVNGDIVEGEVLAFDNHHKIIVLKLPSSSDEKGTCNINFLNIELLKEVRILEETKKSLIQSPALDINKIIARTEQNLAHRQRQSERIGVGVPPEAQKLFDHVSKTFNHCHWVAKDIMVKDVDVTIVPPYKPDNLKGDSKAKEHIKKLIEKFYAEESTTF